MTKVCQRAHDTSRGAVQTWHFGNEKWLWRPAAHGFGLVRVTKPMREGSDAAKSDSPMKLGRRHVGQRYQQRGQPQRHRCIPLPQKRQPKLGAGAVITARTLPGKRGHGCFSDGEEQLTPTFEPRKGRQQMVEAKPSGTNHCGSRDIGCARKSKRDQIGSVRAGVVQGKAQGLTLAVGGKVGKMHRFGTKGCHTVCGLQRVAGQCRWQLGGAHQDCRAQSTLPQFRRRRGPQQGSRGIGRGDQRGQIS